MVFVGVDYGRKRTGIAVFREGLVLPADPVLGSWSRILHRLGELAVGYEGITVILGHPLSALGKPTELSLEVEKFADWLRESGYTVELVNEVGSSAAAGRLSGRNHRNGHVDSLAACEILKRYLNLI
ncbi:MAG: pre-16S rRNA-processing nuclease YqgF [Candidatus Sabulitectum sp.]|nr:pre-16S rRNA-processing nuclease YqgF [Candidatus Sabulitectum sp.]